MSVAAAVRDSKQTKMRRLVLNDQKEYVLINVGPKPVGVPYGGETIIVPPGARDHGQIVASDPAHPHRLASYKNPNNGRYVPGTIVVKDIVKTDQRYGTRQVIWDAAEFIRERIGVNCELIYGQRGIAWQSTDASMEDLAEAAKEAYPRWYESEIKDAKTVVAEEEQRLKVAAMQNRPAGPPADDVLRARALLDIVASRNKKTVEQLMKGFQIDQDGFFSAPTPLETAPSTGDHVDAPLFGGDTNLIPEQKA